MAHFNAQQWNWEWNGAMHETNKQINTNERMNDQIQ